MTDIFGLFVGFTTVDVVHMVDRLPGTDEMIFARDETVSAGGGAANAAVAFAALGGRPMLVSAIGTGPLATLATDDLRAHHVAIGDCASKGLGGLGVSSVMVDSRTGERAIVSTRGFDGECAPFVPSTEMLKRCRVLLWDGHYRSVATPLIRAMRAVGVPIVLDAGTWHPWFDSDLSLVDHAVCSAYFRPPGCRDDRDTMVYVGSRGPRTVTVTHGAGPIVWRDSTGGSGTVEVPVVPAVDTLGAGDIFHGAFAYGVALGESNMSNMLRSAAVVASHSTRTFGTRRWITESSDDIREIFCAQAS